MKFCMICGGLLFRSEESLECDGCRRIYSGILISESAEEDEDFITTEMSVSIESIITRELKSPLSSKLLEVQAEVLEDWKKQKLIAVEALV
ncbi:MAG: hypothetical protein ABH874_03420 [Methanobacteriota archaeon]|jgi:hypothetical protein